MNDRIKDLIEQCTEYWTDKGEEYFDKEKFAELIVRECGVVANSHMIECEGINYGIGTKIKQHFGVK